MTYPSARREIVSGDSCCANPGGETRMAALASPLLGADYPFLDVMWTMFIFFACDLHLPDHPRPGRQLPPPGSLGWAKAAWTLFVIFVPLIGVLV
jgi:hypothetical protein